MGEKESLQVMMAAYLTSTTVILEIHATVDEEA
jgi:hypothetical protein